MVAPLPGIPNELVDNPVVALPIKMVKVELFTIHVRWTFLSNVQIVVGLDEVVDMVTVRESLANVCV